MIGRKQPQQILDNGGPKRRIHYHNIWHTGDT